MNIPTHNNSMRVVGRFYLEDNDTLIYQKRGGGERLIPPNKWFMNRYTPVGEPADLIERMPHDGRKYLEWKKLIGVLRPIPQEAQK